MLLGRAGAGLDAAFREIDPAFPGATDYGLVRQRELLWMRLGPPMRLGPSPRVFAIAGPEVG